MLLPKEVSGPCVLGIAAVVGKLDAVTSIPGRIRCLTKPRALNLPRGFFWCFDLLREAVPPGQNNISNSPPSIYGMPPTGARFGRRPRKAEEMAFAELYISAWAVRILP